MIKRIIKNLLALATGQGIQLLTQLLLPPAFIAAYGLSGYGEWLVLAASIGYLTSLDFGLQTYVLNELTVLYNRGELDQYRVLQSTAFRIILAVLLVAFAMSFGVFFLPVEKWLSVALSQEAACLTVFLLAVQILVAIAFGYIDGTFRVFRMAHRGVMWGNIQKVLVFGVTIGLVMLRSEYWVIALGQVCSSVIALFLCLFDLKRTQPDAFPSLHYWDSSLARLVVKRSSFFGLFSLNNFLLFQVPVLVINRFLGANVVGSFGIARTLFSFGRQILNAAQNALAPEVTRLNGIGKNQDLIRLYRVSESLVLTFSLVIDFALLVTAPLLLRVWLGKPELFAVELYLLLAVVSIVMSVKEYKLYLQYATNRHEATAAVTFLTYLLLAISSVPLVKFFGLNGLIIGWIAIELIQLSAIHSFNVKLFNVKGSISLKPLLKLGMLLTLAAVFFLLGVRMMPLQDYALQVVGAIFGCSVLIMVSYFLYGLDNTIEEVRMLYRSSE